MSSVDFQRLPSVPLGPSLTLQETGLLAVMIGHPPAERDLGRLKAGAEMKFWTLFLQVEVEEI